MIFRLKHTSAAVKLSGKQSDPSVPVNVRIKYTITVNPDGSVTSKPNPDIPRNKRFEIIKAHQLAQQQRREDEPSHDPLL